MQLERVGDDIYAQTTRPEIIVTRCCAPDTSVIKYRNMSTGLVTLAYLSPNYTTDWDAATGMSSTVVLL